MSMLDFNLFMDLHNHTIWSDGADKPEDIILNAINHQIEAVGITDHFCNDDKCSLGFDKMKIYLIIFCERVKPMLILFCNSPLYPSEVDIDYQDEYTAATSCGLFEAALIDLDALVNENDAKKAVRKVSVADSGRLQFIEVG